MGEVDAAGEIIGGEESSMTELVKYDAARRALSEARTLDEVKDLRDKAEAMRAYARQAKNKEMEVTAAEIRIRAERRLGQMLVEQKRTVGLNKGALGSKVSGSKQEPLRDPRPTLADAGIDKKLSSRAQKSAAISEGEFESHLNEWREDVVAANEKVRINLDKASRKAKKVDAHTASIEGGCTVDSLDGLVAEGKTFCTVYADPPWLYDNQSTRGSTDNHYSGLTVEQLCDLPIGRLAAKDAHLHLWTTNGFLFECPKIFEAWGFEFKSSFVWVKSQIGMGNYWRNAHEILLTAVRGDATRFNDKSLRSWIECDRGRHSAKPEQVRHYIERASNGPRLELFGRSSAPGWVVWGNQIERTIFDSSVAAEMVA